VKTTTNDNAVNVLYMLLPDQACVQASVAEFTLWPQRGYGLAVSEVELYDA
jgi:hypothetical protein